MRAARDEMQRQVVVVQADVRVGLGTGGTGALEETEAAGRREHDD